MQVGERQSIEFSQVIGKQCNDITTAKTPSFSTMSPFSQNYENELMQTSFEQDVAEDHINAIWNASIYYLKTCLKIQFDETKGFNDIQIFHIEFQQKYEINNVIGLTEIISKNSILTNYKKLQFIDHLKYLQYLKHLLQKIIHLFCQDIFQQFLLIIFQIFQKYLTFKQTTKLSQQLTQFLAPSSTQIDLNNPPSPTIYYLQKSQSQLIQKADQAAQQISGCYYISTKIKYINLRQVQQNNTKTNKIRNQFQKFIQIISRAVYLCADGCFCHPNGSKFQKQFIFTSENGSFMNFLDQDDRNLQIITKKINL